MSLKGKSLYIAVSVFMLVIIAGGCKDKEASRPLPQETPPLTQETEVKLLRDILKGDPDNLNALIKLGNIMMDTKRFKEAIDAYEKALKIDPKNVDVRVDMGTCLRYSGMPQRAVEEYRKALSINPNHLYAHKNLGIVLTYDLGDKAGGIKEFETYLSLAPLDPDAPQIRKEIQRLRSTDKQK